MAVGQFQASEYNLVGEIEATNVSTFNIGDVDSANITPGPTNAILAGENAYIKYNKWKCTTFGALNQIDDLRQWRDSGGYSTGVSVDCSLRTSGYSQPAYATPNKTTYTDQTYPVADPGSANLGIGGSLTGTITAINQYSDRLKWQVHTTGSTPAGSLTQFSSTFQWREQ